MRSRFPINATFMNLDELIDIEAQTLADRDVPRERVRERDEAIRSRLVGSAAKTRAGRLVQWIHEIRGMRDDGMPGVKVVGSYRLVRAGFVIVAALLGWGAAAATLAFDGSHPVNVLSYLWVFVFLQIIALVLSLVATLLIKLRAGTPDSLPAISLIQSAVRAMAGGAWNRWAKREHEERRERWANTWNRLKERRTLYSSAEQWVLLETFQWGAVAFNVAALIRLLTLVAFTDLAFSWSTTLDLDPVTFHSLIEVIAWPWAAIFREGVPSAELIELTRYARLDGAYLPTADGAVSDATTAGQWWSFLAIATVVWGLLPRIVLLVFARMRLGRFMKGLRFQTPEFAAIDRRISRTGVEIRNERVDPGDDSPLPHVDASQVEQVDAQQCLACRWREADIDDNEIRRRLEEEFGYRVTRVYDAGLADYATDDVALSALANSPAESFALVAEAWESPDRDVIGFLKRVRETLPENGGIIVLLTEGSQEEQQLWINYLGRIADPFLQVVPS